MPKKMNKIYIAQVKSFDDENKTAEVVISTDKPDRDLEIVTPESFKSRLKGYMKHPVLLSSHQYRDLTAQIGKAEKVKVEDKEVTARFKWFVGQGNSQADWGWYLVTQGISAFSIGFIPHAWENVDRDKTGAYRKYTDIELIEISQVLIPSNRGAIQNGIDQGEGVEKELCEMAMKSVKDWDDVEKNYKDDEEGNQANHNDADGEDDDENVKRNIEEVLKRVADLEKEVGDLKAKNQALTEALDYKSLEKKFEKFFDAQKAQGLYMEALFGGPNDKTVSNEHSKKEFEFSEDDILGAVKDGCRT